MRRRNFVASTAAFMAASAIANADRAAAQASTDSIMTFTKEATPDKIADLLTKLSNDDAFRAAMQADPHATLKTYGIEVAPEVKLKVPDKQLLADALKSAKTGPMSEAVAADEELAFLSFVAFFL
ncbi:putative modified peptide [Sinorhizobium meliloti]|uniref:NHLP-related RiPP peptide n=1 Tax=Rhizobium meliloti TaxID=382 RepID=UPI000B49B8AB|nr:NHLP-related RiPP peptide [Sinorhizobium meliloti]ASQ06352.1 putative modified peptide [Sinorhizobium meliloti]MDE3832005.1 NHLP-related RiPP peptide [Sinorhizobium meliloti]MDE4580289.1 NHLP-related RiPP peptide [Sinorhizobium meliloti]MQU70839.1 putative modified peptide [Sinorhizobium meliloti]MQV42343.1 putative modified peptide [Sinorhizobium meliloti]